MKDTHSRGWALITGAGRGLGRALALRASSAGYHTLLCSRDPDSLKELARACRKEDGLQSLALPVDLATPNGAEILLQECRRRRIHPTLLINNAGMGSAGPFLDSDEIRNSELLQLNTHSLVVLCRGFLPAMLADGKGGILNVASTAAFAPGPGSSLYYASKAFVLSFSLALAEEQRGNGLRICCLCPGPMRTAFREAAGSAPLSGARLRLLQDVDKVADIAWRGLEKGQSLIIPGRRNRWLLRASRLLSPVRLARFTREGLPRP